MKPLFKLHLLSAVSFLLFIALAFGSGNDKDNSQPATQESRPQKPKTLMLPENVSGTFVGRHPDDVMDGIPVFSSEWTIKVNHGSFSTIKHRILSSAYTGPDEQNTFYVRKFALVSKNEDVSVFRLNIRWNNPSYRGDPELEERGAGQSFIFFIEVRKLSTTGEYEIVLRKSGEDDLAFFYRTQDITLTTTQ